MPALFPSQRLSIRVSPDRPTLFARVIPKIPVTLTGSGGIAVNKIAGTWTVMPQWTDLGVIAPNPAQEMWVRNPVTNVYNRVTLGALGGSGAIFAIECVIDGGGSVITTGIKSDFEVPFAATIIAATLLADTAGSIVLDVWKAPYGSFPPTVANSITGSSKPTLVSAAKYQDTTLSGWIAGINAGDTLRYNVVGAPTAVKRVTLSLRCTKV